MRKKIGISFFLFFLISEVFCKVTDYSLTHSFLNILVKLYLTIFILVAIIIFLSNLPRPFAVGLTIVMIISLMLFIALTFSATLINYSGHSSSYHQWTGKNFRIESETGQDWAGPNYNNYILYKTKFVGLFKKEISVSPASIQTDSCIIIFTQYSNGDSSKYYFDNCKKELKDNKN